MQYPPVPLAPSSSPSDLPSSRTHKSRPAHKGCQVSAIRQSRDVCPIGVYCEENGRRGGRTGGTCWCGAVYQRKLLSRSLGRPSALKWLRWEAMNRRSNGSFLFPSRHPNAAAAGADGAAIAVSAQDAGAEGYTSGRTTTGQLLLRPIKLLNTHEHRERRTEREKTSIEVASVHICTLKPGGFTLPHIVNTYAFVD